MPSRRGSPAPHQARWITDPAASDFASPERLAFEARSGEGGDGLACWGNPYGRLRHALDLFFGMDQWAMGIAKLPRWAGGWMPGRRYNPKAYEVLPDGPPEWLRAAVDAYQAAEDERERQIIAGNSFPGYEAQMRVRCGIPPAVSRRSRKGRKSGQEGQPA
jgi:hypothetical protein